MPYGKKARTVRAYDYGCLLPTAGSDAALDQMYRRVRFWNALVEWHEPHRQERLALLRRLRAGPGVAKDERLRLTDGERALFRAIDEHEHTGVLARKAESGLYWGNTDDVVVSFHNAVQRAKGAALNFHSARRAIGKTVVRWQTGLPVAGAFGDDTRLRLAPAPAAIHRQRDVNFQLLYTMQIRVGSDGRAPVWLTIPVVLHRPLPPDGLIRQVSIHRERVGPHDGGNPYLWKAVFIVELPTEEGKPVPAGAGRVSIDIGWRLFWVKPAAADLKLADEAGFVQELRVAYWRDETTGQVGEVRLPPRIVHGLRKCEELRSVRDLRFNAARAELVTWLKQARQAEAEVPDWLRAATAQIAKWRSPERLTGVVWRWKNNRFAGDENIYQRLEEWRRRERHLWSYEANSRDQLLKRRLDQYRRFAACIARTYGEVVLEDFDLRAVADLKKHAKDLADEARHQRVMAATSVFRQALENACNREGVTITQVKAKNTTRQCHLCGYTETESIRELVYTCPNGHTWDQDYNAAIQIGRRAVLV